MACLSRSDYLQELSPPYAARHKRPVFMIPNFVNTEVFKPAERKPTTDNTDSTDIDIGTKELRRELGVPADAFVVGCVAALKKEHKRLDVLIREVAALNDAKVFLVLAGAETDETAAVESLAQELLPDSHLILKDKPFESMLDIYRCMDLYVHTASEEIFGICLLESMASAVPVVAHNSEVLKWVVGDGGWNVDVAEAGFLQKAWGSIMTELDDKKASAKRYVAEHFSSEAVIPQFIQMYEAVMKDGSVDHRP